LTKQATIAYSIDTRPPNRSGEATRSDEREEDDEPTRPLRVLGPEDLLPDDETWSHG